MDIRLASSRDFGAIWPIFREVAAAGETYAYPHDVTREQAEALWMAAARETYLVETDGEVLGTYHIKTNQLGGGSHVCNCGYMVAPAARGRGLARAMCEHSQMRALQLGYRAMQFNFVVATNDGAIRLWTRLGFETIGRLPRAFLHPSQGFVDALVMYKWLATP